MLEKIVALGAVVALVLGVGALLAPEAIPEEHDPAPASDPVPEPDPAPFSLFPAPGVPPPAPQEKDDDDDDDEEDDRDKRRDGKKRGHD